LLNILIAIAIIAPRSSNSPTRCQRRTTKQYILPPHNCILYYIL